MNKKSENDENVRNVNELIEEDDDCEEAGDFVSRPFDSSRYLDNSETIFGYLDEALKTGDAQFFARCVGRVAKSVGMTELARRSGISRQTLYDALSGSTSPRLDTIFAVLDAIGVRLSVAAPEARPAGGAPEDAAEPAAEAAL